MIAVTDQGGGVRFQFLSMYVDSDSEDRYM